MKLVESRGKVYTCPEHNTQRWDRKYHPFQCQVPVVTVQRCQRCQEVNPRLLVGRYGPLAIHASCFGQVERRILKRCGRELVPVSSQ